MSRSSGCTSSGSPIRVRFAAAATGLAALLVLCATTPARADEGPADGRATQLLELGASGTVTPVSGGGPGAMLLGRARFHERIGELSEAIRFYEQALALDPNDPFFLENRLRLAALHVKAGQFDKAMAIYAAHRADPRFRSLLSEPKLYAEALVKTGGVERECATLRQALAARPGDARIACDLVDLLETAGRRGEAIEEFGRLARANPANAGYQMKLGGLLQSDGRTTEAVALYETGLALSPDDPGILQKLALTLLSLGRRAEARTRLRGLLRNADAPQEWTALAEKYQELSLTDEAIDLLIEAKGRFSQPPLFVVEIGRAYEVQLAFAPAADWFCRAVELGRDLEGRAALLEMVRTEPDALEPVLAALSKRAAAGEPGTSRFFAETLMNLSLDRGRLKEALEYAENFARAADPVVLFRFYRVARALGEPELADRALVTLERDYPATEAGRMARMERAGDGLERPGSAEIELYGKMAGEAPLDARRATAWTLGRVAEQAGDLDGALLWTAAYYETGLFPIDVAVLGLMLRALEWGRLEAARRAFAQSPDLGGATDIAKGLLLFYSGSVEDGLVPMEDAVLRSPLATGAFEVVDLAFLGRLGEKAALKEWLLQRDARLSGAPGSEAMLATPATGEVAFRRFRDEARRCDWRGRTDEALSNLEAAAACDAVPADACARELLDRYRRLGRKAEFVDLARRFLRRFTASPYARSVKEDLARYETQ